MRRRLRASAVGLLGILLLAGCGSGKNESRVQRSGGLTAQFAPIPDPPVVGHDSSFAVTLTQSGKPVSGAVVNLALFFRSLNQTGPTAVLRETAPGRYEASELSTGMNGKWEAEVTVTRPSAAPARFVFPFSVAR